MLEDGTSRRLFICYGWEVTWCDAPLVVNTTLDLNLKSLGHPRACLFIRPGFPGKEGSTLA